MKLKVSNLLTTITAVLALVYCANAQDELPVLETKDPLHRELNLGEDKTLIYDRTNHPQSVKDSLQQQGSRNSPGHNTKMSRPDANRNTAKDADEDALSFNFLFYMLQKFKLSDLIDQ